MGITTKKTIEHAREIFLNKGLILDESVYTNKSTRMNCHDLDGYKYKLSLQITQRFRLQSHSHSLIII